MLNQTQSQNLVMFWPRSSRAAQSARQLPFTEMIPGSSFKHATMPYSMLPERPPAAVLQSPWRSCLTCLFIAVWARVRSMRA